MRFAYADPPYVGLSKRLYSNTRDYAGEVNHEQLITRLNTEFDGWALSASVKSLPYLLSLCSDRDIVLLSWVKLNAPPMGDGRMYAWEPVILHGGRRPSTPTRTALVAVPLPGHQFREKSPDHVIGEKPEAFARWLFACAGLTPEDEFIDLFPGSGAVGRAWARWRAEVRFVTAEAPSLDFGEASS